MAFIAVETDEDYHVTDKGDMLDVHEGNLYVYGEANQIGDREVIAVYAPGRWITGWKSDTDPFPES